MVEMMQVLASSVDKRERAAEIRQAGQTAIVVQVPMALLSEEQAQRNHRQSLTRLNARGGLGPCEMVAVMERREWVPMHHAEANAKLLAALSAYEAPHGERSE